MIGANGTILPGGRIIRPLGIQLATGPGPHALALGKNSTVTTANTGPERFGITVIEPPEKSGKYGWREHQIWARTPNSSAPEVADPEWRSVAGGIAFDESNRNVWVSEGTSGRIRQIDWTSGDTRKVINLNGGVTGDLAFDNAHRLIYVLDPARSRIDIVDTKTGHVVSSTPTETHPSAIALAPDGGTAFVATEGSACAIDVRDPLKPEATGCVRTDSPAGILALTDRVFVSNARTDSITVVNSRDRSVTAEIPLRIPSLEAYRGIQPAGMAYDPVTKWLLVAETGINAVGVVDTGKNLLIGHLPVGWMPTRVAISGDRVYVANALGRGTGPSNRRPLLELGEVPSLYHGTVSTFIMPDASEILQHTGTVFTNNGFVPWMHDPPKLPEAIKHVVLIEKDGRSFDEVLGDVPAAGNGRVQAFAKLARFGMHGYAEGGRARFSIQDAAITPNQHAIAHQWAFSDNFYVDETDWRYKETNGVTFRRLDDAAELEREPLAQFTWVHLPERESNSYPYEASRVEEKDLEVGRILDLLSHSKWWRETVVFVADSSTHGALDHVDSHRTVLLAAGPYVKRNYVSHTNSSFAGLMRTISELLHVPPANLAEATAAGLQDMFTEKPDFAGYAAQTPDLRIFDPGEKSVPTAHP